MNDSSKQVKLGAMLSYSLIVINALYSLIVTPYIISALGEGEYGVYKTIASFVSTMTVIDFGLGGTVQRFVAKYKSLKEDEKIPNFLAMFLIISIAINAIIAIASVVLNKSLNALYGGSFTAEQLHTAHTLFAILAINLMVITFENVLNGVITGNNKFVFANGVKVSLLFIKIMAVVILLKFFQSAITIVLIVLGITLVTSIAELFYIRVKLNIRARLEKWDNDLFKEAGKYTILMFLTSIAVQIFSNLDNIVIGSVKGPELVTVYSIGLMLFSMFQSLSSGIAGVMLPSITNVLTEDDGVCKAQNMVIKAGRIQFILLGAALVGFICIGKDFIGLWMGQGYDDVYIITLLLVTPSMLELCTNVCHSILRAQNRLGFRTIIVFASAVFNAVFTFILVKNTTYIGAAYATAGCELVFSVLIMNIYYSKKVGLSMIQIYLGIFKRTLLCLVLSGAALFAFSRIVYGTWGAIAVDILVFCVVYGALLLLIGLNPDERKSLPFYNKKKENK